MRRRLKRLLQEVSPVNLLFGRTRDVEHIWPPQNFADRSKFMWLVVDKPLAKRGVFIPRHNLHGTVSPARFRTFHNEHLVIEALLSWLAMEKGDIFFVDIGAGDGIDMSNTYLLAAHGASGIAIDFNPSKFAMLAVTYRDLPNVVLAKCAVTPTNICSLLDGLGAPRAVDVLNLDIDSYDYFVLKELLSQYQFGILCLEINPIFPLSIDFTVNYPSDEWSGDTFQGMSMSMAYKLTAASGYSIVHVDRECLFAVRNDLMPSAVRVIPKTDLDARLDESLAKSPVEWMLKGYRGRSDDELMEKFAGEFRNHSVGGYLLQRSGL